MIMYTRIITPIAYWFSTPANCRIHSQGSTFPPLAHKYEHTQNCMQHHTNGTRISENVHTRAYQQTQNPLAGTTMLHPTQPEASRKSYPTLAMAISVNGK